MYRYKTNASKYYALPEKIRTYFELWVDAFISIYSLKSGKTIYSQWAEIISEDRKHSLFFRQASEFSRDIFRNMY